MRIYKCKQCGSDVEVPEPAHLETRAVALMACGALQGLADDMPFPQAEHIYATSQEWQRQIAVIHERAGTPAERHSPTSITRDRLTKALETGDKQYMGGFVCRLLDAFNQASPQNRDALTLGFEWLPDLYAAWLRHEGMAPAITSHSSSA